MSNLLYIVLVVLLIIGVICFTPWLLMVLVNWLFPIFGCNITITFWQSFGICILLSLVGGFFKKN